jgi:hypothetical protein
MHCSTLNPGHRTHGQGPRHVEGFDGRLLCCKRSSFSSLHRNGDSANKMNQKRSSHLTGVAHRCICTYVRGPSSLPAYARASGWRHGPLPGSRTAGSRPSDCDPVLEAQQAALSVRSASSLSILATHSDHGGEQQQPGLVVAVIQTVVHSVRERSLFRGSPTGHDPGWRGTCFPPGTVPPAPGITVTPWILLSAGGLMVVLGVASDSVLARIIFGRRGDRPGPRAHAETNLSNRPPTRDDAPQQGENNTERNHHERRTLPQQLPQHQLASLARPSFRDGRLHARC